MRAQSFGFIGIGRMGGLMSARLLHYGHEVHVHDVSADALAALTAQGAVAAPSARAAA